jgi:hypothetical protein
MSQEAVSPLRRRMNEDMTVRNFSAETQRNRIRAGKSLSIFLRRSPDTATAADLRSFLLRMTETGVRAPTTTTPCRRSKHMRATTMTPMRSALRPSPTRAPAAAGA